MASHPGTFELFYSGAWHSFTPRDAPGIRITRDEQAGIITSRLSAALDDRQLQYNPRNPTSPLYGLVGRNTPIRVTIDGGIRFYGAVSAWRPRRTPEFDPVTGRGDAWCEIEATGDTRRLGQGKPPARSPMRRAVPASDPVAYWPCEDGPDARQVASAVSGHPPATITGLWSSGEVQIPGGKSQIGSLPLPDLSTGLKIVATVPTDVTTACVAAWAVQSVVGITTGTATGDMDLIEILTPGGTYVRWLVRLSVAAGSMTWAVKAYNAAAVETSVASGGGFTKGGWRLTATQNGANIDVKMYAGDNTATAATIAGTLAGPTQITGNATAAAVTYPVLFGHLALWATVTPALPLAGDVVDAYGVFVQSPDAGPWLFEAAHNRLDRLCEEEGVLFAVSAAPAADLVTRMGVQGTGAFLDLVRETVRTDDGLLCEPRDAAGYLYRPRPDLYNQTPALTLDRAVPDQISPPLYPVVDDVGIRNDVTVKRDIGSSARAVLDAGPMSVQSPPDGVGRADTQVDVNTSSDSALQNKADWHLRKGTDDSVRYESVTFDFDANPALAAAAAGVDIGDVIELLNTEEGGALLLVAGYVETSEGFRRKITFKGPSARPWTVAQVDADTRVDTDGSTLVTGITTTAASCQAASAGLPWGVDPYDSPFDVNIGGERIRVDAVGTILNPNAFLDVDAAGWAGQNAAVSRTTAQRHPRGAAASLFIAPDGVSASGGAQATMSAPGTITPGAQYIACLWAYTAAGWSDLRPAVDWYDAAGGFLSTGLGTGFTVPAGTWTFLTQTFTAPASASRAVMRARHGGTPGADKTWYAWALRLMPVVAQTSPQPFTLTRSRNGIVKAHAAGAPINIWAPARVAP